MAAAGSSDTQRRQALGPVPEAGRGASFLRRLGWVRAAWLSGYLARPPQPPLTPRCRPLQSRLTVQPRTLRPPPLLPLADVPSSRVWRENGGTPWEVLPSWQSTARDAVSKVGRGEKRWLWLGAGLVSLTCLYLRHPLGGRPILVTKASEDGASWQSGASNTKGPVIPLFKWVPQMKAADPAPSVRSGCRPTAGEHTLHPVSPFTHWSVYPPTHLFPSNLAFTTFLPPFHRLPTHHASVHRRTQPASHCHPCSTRM